MAISHINVVTRHALKWQNIHIPTQWWWLRRFAQNGKVTPTENNYTDAMASTKEYEPGTCCIATVKILGERWKAVDGSNSPLWPKSRLANCYKCLFPCWCCRVVLGISIALDQHSCVYIAPNHRCSLIGERHNSIHALRWNINSVTMPMCDVLLRHSRKMLLYVHARICGGIVLSLMYSWCYAKSRSIKLIHGQWDTKSKVPLATDQFYRPGQVGVISSDYWHISL